MPGRALLALAMYVQDACGPAALHSTVLSGHWCLKTQFISRYWPMQVKFENWAPKSSRAWRLGQRPDFDAADKGASIPSIQLSDVLRVSVHPCSQQGRPGLCKARFATRETVPSVLLCNSLVIGVQY